MDLKGKIALVSGGSNGIGKQTALQVINEGATVYITGRNKGRLDGAALEIGAKPILADGSVQIDVNRVFTQIMSKSKSL
jgi:NAD(P)-dependent dehydrogenase (short-subunit alcohol dehydrogenase family)